MAKDIHSINLLPDKGANLVDQFLSWALTVGRLLIILTETLALSVFLYRFSIDMRIVDLRDVIKNQSAIVEQFRSVEDTSRNLQERLTLAKKASIESEQKTTMFTDIIDLGRGYVTFKNLLVSDSLVRMEIQAQSSSRLNAFVNNLKTYPFVEKVSIDTVENKISGSFIAVKITAHLKQSGEQSANDDLANQKSDQSEISL